MPNRGETIEGKLRLPDLSPSSLNWSVSLYLILLKAPAKEIFTLEVG